MYCEREDAEMWLTTGLGLPPAAAHGQQPLERQQPHDETTMTIDT
jgi:hypothetical protein